MHDPALQNAFKHWKNQFKPHFAPSWNEWLFEAFLYEKRITTEPNNISYHRRYAAMCSQKAHEFFLESQLLISPVPTIQTTADVHKLYIESLSKKETEPSDIKSIQSNTVESSDLRMLLNALELRAKAIGWDLSYKDKRSMSRIELNQQEKIIKEQEAIVAKLQEICELWRLRHKLVFPLPQSFPDEVQKRVDLGVGWKKTLTPMRQKLFPPYRKRLPSIPYLPTEAQLTDIVEQYREIDALFLNRLWYPIFMVFIKTSKSYRSSNSVYQATWGLAITLWLTTAYSFVDIQDMTSNDIFSQRCLCTLVLNCFSIAVCVISFKVRFTLGKMLGSGGIFMTVAFLGYLLYLDSGAMRGLDMVLMQRIISLGLLTLSLVSLPIFTRILTTKRN